MITSPRFKQTWESLLIRRAVPDAKPPTLVSTSGTDYYGMSRTNSADYFDSVTLQSTGINASSIRNTTNAAGAAGDAGSFFTDNASAYIGWSAELWLLIN